MGERQGTGPGCDAADAFPKFSIRRAELGFRRPCPLRYATLTTMGFGDYAPATAAGQAFAFLYIVGGLGMAALVPRPMAKGEGGGGGGPGEGVQDLGEPCCLVVSGGLGCRAQGQGRSFHP